MIKASEKNKPAKRKRHKDTFDRIPEKKQQKILDSAITEFAANGYSAANINQIARKAGISIGSMYKYFASKEDLYLAVVDHGYQLLEEIINSTAIAEGDILDKFENILRAAQRYSKMYRKLTQIYLDTTSQGLARLSKKLSRKIETISARFYCHLLYEAKKDGIINSTLDENVTAFCIDNLILLLQFSYTSEYYRERMKIFAGADALDNDEKIIQGMIRFIRGALLYKEKSAGKCGRE
jgi:AcrR family transcriptional regulator